jgi:predicted GNAT family acetyltransferase
MNINILFDEANNRSLAKDGEEEIGQATFSRSDKIWIIDHTYVDNRYRGQGIAKKLVDKVAEEARKQGIKLAATCPYAKKLFESKDEYRDLVL